jgi:hypothetical protein
MERARTENPAPKREKNAKIITGEAQEGKEIRVKEEGRGAGGLGLGGEGTEDDHMFSLRSFLPLHRFAKNIPIQYKETNAVNW